MIETKIKCDGHLAAYSYRQEAKTLSLPEAASERWYEIEIHPGEIKFRQPANEIGFNESCKHACSAEHARRVVQQAIDEMIPDLVEEKKEDSEIPY